MKNNKPFNKMTLIELMTFLEDLDAEASILNKSTTSLLEKEKVDKKIPAEIFNILNNTLQSMKRGEISCNGQEIKPYEENKEIKTNYFTFAIDLENAYKPKSTKDLGGWLDNLEDWDITGFSILGANFTSREICDKFAYDVKTGIIYLISDKSVVGYSSKWKLGEDFTHILHEPERGVYLLKEENETLYGVTMLRYSLKDTEEE